MSQLKADVVHVKYCSTKNELLTINLQVLSMDDYYNMINSVYGLLNVVLKRKCSSKIYFL